MLRRLRWLFVVLLVAAAVGIPSAQNRSLKILLTNDDGYEAPGLRTMHAALRAAGHRVTVVAPATNMSSTSMSMTSGDIRVESKGEGIWAVHGTPADAASIGIARLLPPQDLVVSGTNAGANLGTSTNNSGTVGAAIAATRYGLPAIAASAGTGPAGAAAYDVAATLVTQMITALDAGRPADGRLLPPHLVINVNVPAVRLLGIRWAPLSARSLYARVYSDTGVPNAVRSQLIVAEPPAGEQDTDLALFVRGYVTLTLLDGDVSVSSATAAPVVSRLSKLALPAGAR